MLYVAGIMTIIIQIIACVCFFYKYIYFSVTIPCDKKNCYAREFINNVSPILSNFAWSMVNFIVG